MTTDQPQNSLAPLASLAKAAWWAVLLRGILAVILAILLFVSPSASLAVILAFVAAYFIVEGVTAVIYGIRAWGVRGSGWMITQGVISVIAGIVAIAWPGLTALVLLYILAFWAIVIGIGQVFGAFSFKRLGVTGWYWSLISGVLSVILGIVLIANPGAGLLGVLAVAGAFLLASGLATIALAFVIKAAAKQVTR